MLSGSRYTYSLSSTRENPFARVLTPPVQPADPKPAETVVLKEGTEVSLKFAQNLTSKAVVAGQPVELVLAEDLKVLDHVVIKRGARVLGTVTSGKESEKKRTRGEVPYYPSRFPAGRREQDIAPRRKGRRRKAKQRCHGCRNNLFWRLGFNRHLGRTLRYPGARAPESIRGSGHRTSGAAKPTLSFLTT